MASRQVKIGQQVQRMDSAGLVFEVVEPVASIGPPHMRVRRVDDPTDMRVFSLSALADRHMFRVVSNQTATGRSGAGHLRLSPT